MKILMYLTFVVIFIFSIIHELLMDDVAVSKTIRFSTWSVKLRETAGKVAVLYLCWRLGIPLPAVYALVYAGYCFACRGKFRESKSYFYVWTNLHFIFFMSLHLMSLSTVALITGNSLRDTQSDKMLWLLIMALTIGLGDLLEFLAVKGNFYGTVRRLSADALRFRRFIYFECYAVCYLLFDSIPCMVQLQYSMIALFLIVSCFLLLLQVLLFIVHTSGIVEKAHYEAEYYRLEEERAQHIRKEMELQKLAFIDSLTGTYTRRYAMEMLRSMQKDKKSVTVAYIDVNGLKKVNDTLGHQEGDRYLIAVANSLNSELRKNDVLARIGGDEFLIVADGMERERIEKLLSRRNRELQETKGSAYSRSFSFGVSEAEKSDGIDMESLIEESDRRMYVYKTGFKRGEHLS